MVENGEFNIFIIYVLKMINLELKSGNFSIIYIYLRKKLFSENLDIRIFLVNLLNLVVW